MFGNIDSSKYIDSSKLRKKSNRLMPLKKIGSPLHYIKKYWVYVT